MKRPASHMGTPLHDADLQRELLHCTTQTGLISAISALSKAGWLKDEVVEANLITKKRLQRAKNEGHCERTTPYGTVLQRMALPLAGLPYWEYIHPMALLHYLTAISTSFASIMDSCLEPGLPLRLVLYIDEVCPGNPLRPEKSRTLQAIYWCFADWPQWLLQRTAAWPTFATIRSTLVDKLPGKVAGLMARVLLTFFPTVGHSFARGVSIQVSMAKQQLVTSVFAGFLCDEKAHNQVAGTKGASGPVYDFDVCISDDYLRTACHSLTARSSVTRIYTRFEFILLI